jgi:hypothetical protein
MAGQAVMQGFVNFSIPITLRRLITMLPALVAIYFGLDPIRTLVLSQVVLSFYAALPDHRPDPVHARRRAHGQARQPPIDDRHRECVCRPHRRVECDAALPNTGWGAAGS